MKASQIAARIAMAAMLCSTSLLAQTTKGWMVRADRSNNASDPDGAGAIKFVPTGTGFHATNPQAAVFWNPANTAAGTYTLRGTFTLIQASGHSEYYGLVFGGSDLDGPGQNYLYFMIAPDGSTLVKHRAADGSAHTISAKTPSDAVKQPGNNGSSTNTLEVRVMADKIDFAVNGTVVSSLPKAGQPIKSDGIYGIRVNHMLEVQVDKLGISKQ